MRPTLRISNHGHHQPTDGRRLEAAGGEKRKKERRNLAQGINRRRKEETEAGQLDRQVPT